MFDTKHSAFPLDFCAAAFLLCCIYFKKRIMEIKQFEYFAAVCEHGSFNKAAAALYTTQPNVSKVIGRLEEELGRQLFARTKNGICLTADGEALRLHVHGILEMVEKIHREVGKRADEK